MADMKLRQTMKSIQVDNKAYRIRKMPPWTATYMVKLVAAKLLPILAITDITTTNDEGAQVIDQTKVMSMLTTQLPSLLDAITEEQLKNLMQKSLHYCDAMYLPAGPQPIMEGEYFCITDVETDFALCIRLVAEVIIFNTADFFGASGFSLDKLTKTLSEQKL